MDFEEAKNLAKELKIDIERIVREYWEMIILREISQSKLGDFLIFAGGTALRLAFGSPRFSDDLDFYLRKNLSFSFFEKEMKKIAKKQGIEITDLYNKFFTFLAEFKIKVNFLPLPFRTKIEVRKKILKRGFESRLLISPTVNFQVLISVLNLETIKKLKFEALKERKEPRDLFDLWFISQKLKIPFEKPKVKIEKKILKQSLLKYLPSNFKKAIEEISK